MPHGAISQAQGQTPTSHHRSCGSHASGCCSNGLGDRGPWRHPGRTWTSRCGRCLEGVSRRPKRVQDRLVAHRAAPTSGQAICRGTQHRREGGGVKDQAVTGDGASFQKGRPVQRTRRATDGRHELMSDGPQQFSGPGIQGQVQQGCVHGPKPDHQIVPMISIAKDRVQPRQIGGMTGDHDPAALEGGTQGRSVHGRGGLDGDGMHVPTIGLTPPSTHLLTRRCFFLDDTGTSMSPTSNVGSTEGGAFGGLGPDQPQRVARGGSA